MAIEVLRQVSRFRASLEGDTAFELYLISGLTGFAARNRAMEACRTSGVPKKGDQYLNTDLVAITVESEFVDEDKYRVHVNFGMPVFGGNQPPDNGVPIIRGGSTMNETQTSRDIFGDPIEIPGWKRTVILEDPDSQTSQPVDQWVPAQVAQVQMYEPNTIVSFSRTEKQMPLDNARKFIGTINSVPIFGDPVGYWMICEINWESSDGGQTYLCTYSFQFNPSSWFVDVHAVEPDDSGRLAADAEPGRGIKTGIRVHRFADPTPLAIAVPK